jgi:hypothetical protein
MKIPNNLGSLSDLKAREKKAFAESAQWEDTLDDAYEFFLPNRNLFNREGRGQKKMDRIFDGTGPESIKIGASKLQENIAPIWARWANYEPSGEILRQIEASQGDISEKDIRENLEEQAAITFDIINRSNFATQFYEFGLDLLIGTATMSIEEDESDEMPVIFKAIPQIGIAFEEGPRGVIETHWWRLKVKARNLERQWVGFKPSLQMSKLIKDSPDEMVDVCQGVVFDHLEQKYYLIVWVHEEESISFVDEYDDTSPMVTARYSKTSGEVRGRGPVLDVLPNVKSLNKAKEYMLTKAAIDLSGMWTATDDGVTNPYNIKIAPGIVIPVGSNNSQNPSLQRLDTSTDLNLGLFVVEDMQNDVRRALFNDIREPDDSVVSATQFAIESRELAKRIGSAFGRIQTEALIPILKRVHSILVRRGILQPIKIGGREVAIKFTSPLARAQDAEDLLSFQQAVEFTRAVGGDEAVQLSFKVENAGTWAAQKTGSPQELSRTETEKKEMVQAAGALAEQGIEEEAPQQPQAV